ncbi:DUF1349 domain-containing protein [Phyllobacterium sp. YR531]|uniref:DUF1349 domain-containing protein n=1 Tax=Phyllobacterium sp. YR531 TaxID=1144343 RepID=UPI00026F7EA5|nr:DUF1349 domain-containing protein [Phyllobacterium sp. YR531]EJN01689.1 hypothetical protein PMI41_03405 [Phyllobacterium sp. YR531]
MSSLFSWLNEPAVHTGNEQELKLVTDDRTDFWQRTFYGFERDNGHAYLAPVSGDFSAIVTIRGEYEELYDQAGLLLRIDERNWIKAGIEYTDDLMHFSVVVTNGISDWSVIPLYNTLTTDEISVRLTRHGDAVRVQYSINGGAWQMARLAPFSSADAAVGAMACSPERAGFKAGFTGLKIGPAISRNLHDDEASASE